MTPELQSQFERAFPKLYRQGAYLPGDGWFKILWDLSAKLEHMIEAYETENPSEDVGPICASQVKEKFGGLRFYLTHGTEEMFNAIEEAEHLSYRTCEQCGMPGEAREGGWILTLCDECQAKR